MNNELFAAELIKQFAGIWPSFRNTMSQDDIFNYQVQMIKALTENELNTQEAIQQGFKKARSEGGQYLPSVPEFVRWCKVQKTTQNLYIAPPSYSLTKEECDRFTAMSKNLLESMK